MESSAPLATDSFSQSWLSDFKPPLLNCLLEEEEEPPLKASMNSEGLIMAKPKPTHQSFNFDLSVTLSPPPPPPAGFAHADELFSDGFIRPVYGHHPSKLETFTFNTHDSKRTMPSSLFHSGIISPRSLGTYHHHHHGFVREWRRSTQRILRNSFGYFKQLCRRVGCSMKSTRVGDFEKTEWEVKSWNASQQASPISSTVKAYSMGDDLVHYENSIHEAVLHCKRSIGT